MPNFAPTLTLQNRSAGIDLAIGQIDLIGESGEVAKTWRIRKPRCTIGSSPDCTIQIASAEIASIHATLVFGKKHTLLRSVGPTLISQRHVREWLIDESTEIVIGQSRLVVHPSNCILANVVHAENLIGQASRLCKDPTPVNASVAPQAITRQIPEQAAIVPASKSEPFDAIAATRLDSIEKLLESLRLSLDKMQASIGLEAKSSSESIVQSVSLEIDEFGKRLFTDLNKQIANQTGVQESLITGIADQFSGRFGAIDNQLNRFYESSTFQTSTLNELLAQAAADQKQIETRFQEVSAHRNELMDAVQILRTEILLANSPGSQPSFQPQNQFSDGQTGTVYAYDKDSSPANTDYEYHQSNSTYQADSQISEASGTTVTDEQLAQSLELAQIQIHELNQQLRNLEIERDEAVHRIASLSESWQVQQEQFIPPFESNSYTEATPVADFTEQPTADLSYDTPSYPTHEEVRSTDSVENAYDESAYTAPGEEPQAESSQFEAPQVEASQFEAPTFPSRELPAWFKQDEPQELSYQAESSYSTEQEYTPSPESNFSFSTPDLSSYSDADYPAETSVEPSPEYQQNTEYQENPEYQENSLNEQTKADEQQIDSNLGDYSSNLENLDSISNRLQRMLADADQRRAPANPNSKPRTSQSWSQKFNTPPAAAESTEAESTEDASSYGSHHSSFVDTVQSKPIDPEPVVESIGGRYDELAQDAYPDEPVDHDLPHSEAPVSASNDNANFGSRQEQEPESVKESDEEESIEAYMQRLLNRVRGEAEKSPAATQTKTPIAEVPSPAVQANPTKPRSRVAASMGLEMEDSLPPPSERLSEELFVPRQQAPEQRNDLAALRELANTNARRAITRSDIRRTNSAFFLKLGVTALAVFSAVALFLFNGFTLNAPFAGMVAAIVVALLWGFDCVNHFRRLKNVGLNQATPAETAAGQSIRVGNSDDESGWRPTPA